MHLRFKENRCASKRGAQEIQSVDPDSAPEVRSNSLVARSTLSRRVAHRLPGRDVCHRHARTDERVGGRTWVGLSQPEKGQDSSNDDHQSDEVDNAIHDRLLSMPAVVNERGELLVPEDASRAYHI